MRTQTAKTFSPLKSGRKSDEVFAQIAAFIRDGRFAPGAKLPAERELAATFNTSRQTIREALYRAELTGLIEVRHGAGSFVTAPKPDALDEPLIALIRKEAHRIAEFFEIRRALEGWCAVQAAKVAPEAALAEMKARLDAMRHLAVNDDDWERNDIAFHAALAGATGNPIAVRIMAILREGFSAFYRFKRFIPNREEQELIWQHHVDIYEAVRRRDSEAARGAIIGHMDFIEQKLAEGMSGIEP
jgi:GntR family transcriptional regulator, transcriptional repressor for pyruvate dehydrogenase complex